MSNKLKYPKKKINNKTYILCRNSDEESPYFKGTICTEWVLIDDESIAAVCSKCVNENQKSFK